MTVRRRVFNGYLGIGLITGGSIGFVAGRLVERDEEPTVMLAVRDALREAAAASRGIHQLGLAVAGVSQISDGGAERALLTRLGYEGTEALYTQDLMTALDTAIRRDYADGNLAPVGQYILSETEKQFVAYALVQRGLNNTAYTPPEPEIRDGVIAAGAKFGPRYTVAGQIFNEQPDGHGGLWVLAKNTPPGTVILINGKKIKTNWKASALTGAIYGKGLQALIQRPAKHEIALFVPETGLRQVIGEMEVRPRPPAARLEGGGPSTVFCEIEEWSVKDSEKGEKLRIRTYCGPRSSAVYIGDVALTTRVTPRSIEAILDRSVLPTGEHPLRLVDSRSGEAVRVGTFKMQ